MLFSVFTHFFLFISSVSDQAGPRCFRKEFSQQYIFKCVRIGKSDAHPPLLKGLLELGTRLQAEPGVRGERSKEDCWGPRVHSVRGVSRTGCSCHRAHEKPQRRARQRWGMARVSRQRALRARSLCFVLPQASWPIREAFKNIAQRLSVEEPNLARYGLTLGRGGRGTCGDSGAVRGEPSAILLHGPRPRAGFSHTRGPDGQ